MTGELQKSPTLAADERRRRVMSLIEHRAVGAAFQPIVDLHDGLIIAFEGLCRPAPTSGYKNPGELFEDAERAGMLWELEEVTRSAVVGAAEGWPRDVRLFFNTTPTVFGDERFPDELSSLVKSVRGLTPERVTVELTELSETGGVLEIAKRVARLREAGFSIAVDDVGAGTSGLSRIMVLRPDWLKLDRQFIQDIDRDRFKQNLVRFFVHFARLSGVKVIAEGIERENELATVIGLGVRFGQGFFLGRPVAPDLAGDRRLRDDVRAKWAGVEAAVSPAPGSTPLRRLCGPVVAVQAGTTVAELAQVMLSRPDAAGAVLLEGRRFSGWCGRQLAIDAARTIAANRPASAIAVKGVCMLPPTATVQDGLQLVCVREEDEMTSPLVVAEGPDVIGVVKLRDLLQAAASEFRGSGAWRAPLTGLPSRVLADRHIVDMIACDSQAGPTSRRHDAAVIDVRRFSDFNATFGYELGDKLLRELGDLLDKLVCRGEDDVFLAHLTDDRFLVTAPSGTLEERLAGLIEAFDDGPGRSQLLPPQPVTAPSGDAPLQCPPVGIRVMLMPSVFGRITHARDLYRIEQQLRQKTPRDTCDGPGVSVLVVDTRYEQEQLRRSA